MANLFVNNLSAGFSGSSALSGNPGKTFFTPDRAGNAVKTGANTEKGVGLQSTADSKGKPESGRTKGTEECQTCKNRRYKDGSNEMVSFKTPTHISPQAASAAVRSHEQEHVTNAYAKAAAGNGRVIRASVSIHMDICPECGRSYVSGGTTNTQIKYYNEENPYQQDLIASDGLKYRGMNTDCAV